MSEKRFVFATNEKWFLFDNETEDYLDMEDCKDKLNEMSDENEQLKEENEQLKHWNKCLAEKRHNEKESNENSIKKLIGKIDFLERIIDGDL